MAINVHLDHLGSGQPEPLGDVSTGEGAEASGGNDYKGRLTLVSIVPKITARWRQMEFYVQNLVKMKGVL